MSYRFALHFRVYSGSCCFAAFKEKRNEEPARLNVCLTDICRISTFGKHRLLLVGVAWLMFWFIFGLFYICCIISFSQFAFCLSRIMSACRMPIYRLTIPLNVITQNASHMLAIPFLPTYISRLMCIHINIYMSKTKSA